MLTWHDMRADISGSNTPDMEVPRFVPEVAAATEAEDEDADPFGEDEEVEEDPFGEDEEEDPFADEEEDGAKFSDAVAIQIPAQVEEGFKKPYFIFGDSGSPVHLWHADLASKKATVYLGKGSSGLSEVSENNLSVIAQYDHGQWTVIFKRPKAVEKGLSLDKEESFVPIAFSVWDGTNEERGNKRGLTTWFSMYIKPMEEPSALVPMLTWGGGLLLLELLIIFFVRKKHRTES